MSDCSTGCPAGGTKVMAGLQGSQECESALLLRQQRTAHMLAATTSAHAPQQRSSGAHLRVVGQVAQQQHRLLLRGRQAPGGWLSLASRVSTAAWQVYRSCMPALPSRSLTSAAFDPATLTRTPGSGSSSRAAMLLHGSCAAIAALTCRAEDRQAMPDVNQLCWCICNAAAGWVRCTHPAAAAVPGYIRLPQLVISQQGHSGMGSATCMLPTWRMQTNALRQHPPPATTCRPRWTGPTRPAGAAPASLSRPGWQSGRCRRGAAAAL